MGFSPGFRLTSGLALLLAIPAIGCSASPKERLRGKWVGEVAEDFPPAQLQRAQGWATGTSIEFQRSRVIVSIPAEGPRQGTYKVAKGSDEELAVTFMRPHGPEDQATFRFEGDRLRWMLDGGGSIVMRKVSD